MDDAEMEGCYCGTVASGSDMLTCQKCSRLYHIGCLKYGRLSPLSGDTFYTLICARCSDSGEESYTRIKLPWQSVVMLVLYNLHLGTAGKQGYFHWKEHICASIEKYWLTLFGSDRKKTVTWRGTVAGTLSAGCPVYFCSGTNILAETGWWALTQITPPTTDMISLARQPGKRPKKDVPVKEPLVKVEGLRRRRTFTSSIEAAIALRARRDTTQEPRRKSKAASSAVGESPNRTSASVDTHMTLPTSSTTTVAQDPLQSTISPPDIGIVKPEPCRELQDYIKQEPGSSTDVFQGDHGQYRRMSAVGDWSEKQWLTEQQLKAGEEGLPKLFLKEEDDDSDFEIDPCALSSPVDMGGAYEEGDGQPPLADMLAPLTGALIPKQEQHELPRDDDVESTAITAVDRFEGMAENETPDFESKHIEIKSEIDQSWLCTVNQIGSNTASLAPSSSTACSENDGESKSETESESGDSEAVSTQTRAVHRRMRRKLSKYTEQPVELPLARHVPLSLYEERELLRKMTVLQQSCPRVWRMRRKMLLRLKKRGKSLAPFDIDRIVERLTSTDDDQQRSLKEFDDPCGMPEQGKWKPKADAFVLDRFQMLQGPWHQQARYTPFRSRLVGFEDDQLQSIHSPYTARLLKPFIRRDYESLPQKLKLLRELQTYGNRSDPDWILVKSPIDYCYVHPQHIPSINTLCNEFFWPGIDLSECLQYPDFSCVVLYRRLVIGFAFMVPDVKYNEAYISFILTHPEWTGAGIGQFMIYHLIQTCMGKDVTLHVAVDNPAMLLYQKFGFKPQELILGFYDRYFADNSQQSRHAFLMRLHR